MSWHLNFVNFIIVKIKTNRYSVENISFKIASNYSICLNFQDYLAFRNANCLFKNNPVNGVCAGRRCQGAIVSVILVSWVWQKVQQCEWIQCSLFPYKGIIYISAEILTLELSCSKPLWNWDIYFGMLFNQKLNFKNILDTYLKWR